MFNVLTALTVLGCVATLTLVIAAAIVRYRQPHEVFAEDSGDGARFVIIQAIGATGAILLLVLMSGADMSDSVSWVTTIAAFGLTSFPLVALGALRRGTFTSSERS